MAGGVSASGLDKDALSGSGRKLLSQGHGLLRVRYGPDVVGGEQRTKTRHSLLQHGGFANDVEELLWRAGAAAWPETRAAPPSQDNRVGAEIRLHLRSSHGESAYQHSGQDGFFETETAELVMKRMVIGNEHAKKGSGPIGL